MKWDRISIFSKDGQPIEVPRRFDPDTERLYLETKYRESKGVVTLVGFSAAALALVLWAWDWVIDPVRAPNMLGSRLLLMCLLLLIPIGLIAGIKRTFLPLYFYSIILLTQVLFVHHLSKLDGGLVYGISGLMYWFILPIFLALPFSAPMSALGFVLFAFMPNAYVWVGIGRELELAKYNIISWPTCVIAIFVSFLLDLLFRSNFIQMQERNRLIKELRDSIATVKVLRGMLPICASCKKVRDDKGYWNQIEAYISTHTEAEFTHGICPECLKKLYPEATAHQGSTGAEPGR